MCRGQFFSNRQLLPVRVVRVSLRVVEIEVGEDQLNSLVRTCDQRVAAEYVGRVRVRIERRHDRVWLRRHVALAAPP